jgi:hypothetical protein
MKVCCRYQDDSMIAVTFKKSVGIAVTAVGLVPSRLSSLTLDRSR